MGGPPVGSVPVIHLQDDSGKCLLGTSHERPSALFTPLPEQSQFQEGEKDRMRTGTARGANTPGTPRGQRHPALHHPSGSHWVHTADDPDQVEVPCAARRHSADVAGLRPVGAAGPEPSGSETAPYTNESREDPC
ncbi:hypothetical protein GCM10023083_89170 [Streptomyces phyllanthi]